MTHSCNFSAVTYLEQKRCLLSTEWAKNTTFLYIIIANAKSCQSKKSRFLPKIFVVRFVNKFQNWEFHNFETSKRQRSLCFHRQKIKNNKNSSRLLLYCFNMVDCLRAALLIAPRVCKQKTVTHKQRRYNRQTNTHTDSIFFTTNNNESISTIELRVISRRRYKYHFQTFRIVRFQICLLLIVCELSMYSSRK